MDEQKQGNIQRDTYPLVADFQYDFANQLGVVFNNTPKSQAIVKTLLAGGKLQLAPALESVVYSEDDPSVIISADLVAVSVIAGLVDAEGEGEDVTDDIQDQIS